MALEFDALFSELFEREFPRLFRYLDRLSGEPDLAADLAQEAFVRLNDRGELPDHPPLWLITVALNLFRNVKTTRSRRRRLFTATQVDATLADPSPDPAENVQAEETRAQVRRAIDRLDDRDRQLLLLRAEGYSYRDMASVLGLNENSVGTLLARAKRAFREAYGEDVHAS
ncbi:MAG TPA: sigma-70 family RNA polymerase sigma factor [Gemmatimonadales bacterium]|nr:sigma-70 family RNA polymerase sigma factor [Gemmatimonadales bacterium]